MRAPSVWLSLLLELVKRSGWQVLVVTIITTTIVNDQVDHHCLHFWLQRHQQDFLHSGSLQTDHDDSGQRPTRWHNATTHNLTMQQPTIHNATTYHNLTMQQPTTIHTVDSTAPTHTQQTTTTTSTTATSNTPIKTTSTLIAVAQKAHQQRQQQPETEKA